MARKARAGVSSTASGKFFTLREDRAGNFTAGKELARGRSAATAASDPIIEEACWQLRSR